MRFLRHLALAAVFGLPLAATADEALFGYVYGTDTLPKGELEIQTTVTHRWDKGMGSYKANDLQLELEYGVTDKFAVAGYLLGLDIEHEGAFPTDEAGDVLYEDRNGTYFRGVKAQFKYNVSSPYHEGGIGFTVFAEPQYITRFKVDGSKTKQLELELGALLQKNFFNDQLVLAGNTVVARERRVLVEDDNFVEHEWEFYQLLGASWRVANNFYAGLEARHHMDVLRNDEGDYNKNQYSFFVGPTLHYATKAGWVTLSYLRQTRGNPSYAASVGPVQGGVDNGLHMDENEKNELRLKFGLDF